MSESRALPALAGQVGADLARDAAERALKLDPLHPTVAPLLSALYIKSRQPRLALRVIAPLLERDPHRVELLRLQSSALSALGARGEAERALTRALSLDPFNVWVRFELGLSAQVAQRWSEARALFNASLKLEPAWREAWLNLGWVELQSGRGAEALSAFKRALKLTSDPSRDSLRAQAQLGAALSLETLGQASEASVMAQRALTSGAHGAIIWSLLGRLALAEGKLAEAREAFERSVEFNPQQRDVWAQLSEVYRRLGDEDRARRARLRSLSQEPD